MPTVLRADLRERQRARARRKRRRVIGALAGATAGVVVGGLLAIWALPTLPDAAATSDASALPAHSRCASPATSSICRPRR
ncbi:hypothetical protein [Microbacterium sp. NIBRBAC000506063]|uniref:hypothetical protein n=1 Tax=Microbacterium sp. NIBRBAC000506063 TaxID=2734618 RepID=UPI001BB6B97C|nr:hypothetical protein [Microbacterium sp. NIBRBAC000506063]QTV80160.1 hypothetical protein KAE78_03610 [Microbacterium sp. NIBRBAC000506063]